MSASSFSNLSHTNVLTDSFYVATIESCLRLRDLRRLLKQLSGPNSNCGSKFLGPLAEIRLHLYSVLFSLVAHYVSGRALKRLGSYRAFFKRFILLFSGFLVLATMK